MQVTKGLLLATLAASATGVASPPALARGTTVAGATAPGTAAAGNSIYVPYTVASAAEVCSPPKASSPQCDGSGWTSVCGGFGRIRDLLTLDSGLVLAVGDGVATFTYRGAGYDHTAWASQLNTVLTGLNHLTVPVQESIPGYPDPPSGWAVGERDLIARLESGCWRRASGGDNSTIELRAVSLTLWGDGWAVGKSTADAEPHSALARHAATSDDWWDHTHDAARLPPLTDVQVISTRGEEVGAWAVGCAAPSEGWFVRAQPDWRWLLDNTVDGCPVELAITEGGSGGWAFGHAAPEPGGRETRHSNASNRAGGIASWRYSRAQGWQPADFSLPDRELIDAYLSNPLDGDTEVWVGVSPAGPSQPVLYRSLGGDRPPSPLGYSPPESRLVDGPQNRAIAPLRDDRALYAYGDQVWLLEKPPNRWRLVRDRARLVDLAPSRSGHWLLATDTSGSRLYHRDASRIKRALAYGDDGGGPEPLPPLRAIGSAGGSTWAVGDGGASLQVAGGMGRWQWISSPGAVSGDFRAVVATGRDDVWAAGVDRDGHGRLWRFRQDEWQPWLRTRGETPFSAVTSTSAGDIWAVGRGVMVSVDPGCPPDDETCTSSYPIPDTVSLVSIAPVGPGQIVAAGEHLVAFASKTRIRLRAPRVQDGSLALPYGSRLVAVAAAGTQDVWAAYNCCSPASPPDRQWSGVLHFDGATWRQDFAINVPIDALAVETEGLRRTVWLVGDWTTVASKTYAVPTAD